MNDEQGTMNSSRRRPLIAHRSALGDFSWPIRVYYEDTDSLQVTVELVKVGASQIVVAQQVMREGEALVTAEVKVACVDAQTFKPVRIPKAIITRIGTTS